MRRRLKRSFCLGLECLEDRTLLAPTMPELGQGNGPVVLPHQVPAVSNFAITTAAAETVAARRALSTSGNVITVPGPLGQAVVVTFTLMRRSSRSRSEVGLFLVDDLRGRVHDLRPGDRGYAVAALSRRMILFDRGQERGATKEIVLPAGSHFGAYLVKNNTSNRFLARNPTDRPGRRPLAFFSIPAANPDHYAHVLRRPSENILRIEDQWGGGDRDHNDALIRFSFHPTATDDTPPAAPTGLDLVASSDTGRSDHDDITNDRTPTIRANVEPGALVRFYADGLFAGEALANGGAEWTSGPLGDGVHIITATATDAAANLSPVSAALVVTVDTVAPSEPSLDLDPVSDTPPVGDGETTAEAANLVGHAEPGADVSLEGANRAAIADGAGRFLFSDVPLALGGNSFAVRATDVAGNSTESGHTITRRPVASDSDQNAVLAWNKVTLDAIRLDASPPPVASRALAMVHSAIYDAVSAIDGLPGLYTSQTAAPGASADGAVAAAAHRVLEYLYPVQQATLDAAFATALAPLGDGAAKANSVTLGTSIADSVIAFRSHDGWDRFVVYDGGQDAGQWRATAPMFDVALLPQWATLDPFTMTSASQFQPEGPPSLNSQTYTDAFNEVKDLGRANGSARTPEQTAVARFWADGAGSYTPPGHWNQIADQIAEGRGLSLLENARLFAELNLALADAAIAAWQAKYAYGSWRPITAIADAAADGNPSTNADADWQPFLITPNFPEYVSGHSTFSAAAATILAAAFGDATTFTTGSLTLPGVERTFPSFSAAAAEAGRSRIYGGIHYEFSNQDGLATGRKVGNWVLQYFSTTVDSIPPKVIVESPSDSLVTNQSPLVSGRVLDNLSGVARLESQLDDGPMVAVALDGQGRFTIAPGLPLDGTADGTHILRLAATDRAGNSSAPRVVTFTLDTRSPVIALATPVDGGDVSADMSASGAVDGTGSPVTALAYQIDGGAATPLTFDPATGAISGTLDLSLLAPGSHTVVVTARDAAGNTSILSRAVELSSRIALTAMVMPDDGAEDVGVTFRPRVTFSRPVDASTLTSSSYFATGPGGAALPATIVPAADGKSAWLFFAAALPGGAKVVLHVDGSRIRALADGQLLDADGDGAPGGSYSAAFTTVSLAPLLGTSLSGRIIDPGPDLKPMTFDDTRPGPDGALHTADDVFLRPIVGVRVFIIGLESQAVLSDAAGRFHFDAVPAGDVKVVLDGRTATNAPAGYYFPEMVMDATVKAGRANTLMGSMGTLEEQTANADREEVYLPRLGTSILQDVSATEPTVIGLDRSSASGLTPEKRDRLKITVQPGSMIGVDGQPLAGAQVGISLVPPELVRDMLPQGLMQLAATMTIQAPGVAAFSTPLQLTFPNVYGAAPGAKLDVYSFDHTTGRLEITGTATVSADGLAATTDPDGGITHPGWFGPLPLGTPTSPPCNPTIKPIVNVTPVPYLFGVSDRFFVKDTDKFDFNIANYATPLDAALDPCDPINAIATPLVVKITVDGQTSEFLEGGVVTQQFNLLPRQSKTIHGEMKDLLKDVKNYPSDVLYGATVTLKGWRYGAPTKLLIDKMIYIYRYLDVSDAPHINGSGTEVDSDLLHTDGVLEMPDTAADGSGPTTTVSHFRQIQFKTGNATPTLSVIGNSFSYSSAARSVIFDPIETRAYLTATIQIRDPLNNLAGTLMARGNGVKQVWYVDTTVFTNELIKLVQAHENPSGGGDVLSDDEHDLLDSVPERDHIVQGALARAEELLSSFSPGLERITTSTDDAVRFDVFEAPSSTPPDRLGLSEELDNETNGGVAYLVAHRTDYSKAVQNNLLSTNLNKKEGGQVGIYLDHYFGLLDFSSPQEIINTLAKTFVHELGHGIGLTHTAGNGNFIDLAGAFDDVMSQGQDLLGQRTFEITTNAMRVGLGLDWTQQQGQQAITYYDAFIRAVKARGNFDALPDGSDGNVEEFTFNGPVARIVSDADQAFVIGELDLGPVSADGIGGQSITRNFHIANLGDQPLVIGELQLLNSPPGMSITPIAPGTVVDAGADLGFAITFDPTLSGPASAQFSLASNALAGTYLVDLSAQAVSPNGDIRAEVENNNFGGQAVGAGAITEDTFVTLRNLGASPLSVTGIRMAHGRGEGEYGFTNLPADLGPSHPIVIAPGGSFPLGVAFNPDAIGLRPGTIEILSDDTDTPILRQAVVGIGLADVDTALDYGNDFVAIETPLFTGAPTLRQRSDGAGNWSVFLPAGESIHYAIFDPVSGLIAHGYDVSAASGVDTPIHGFVFLASTANDSDGDGLPDDVEFAIGTGQNLTDTDRDGLSDFAEIVLDTDPLGGLAASNGVISADSFSGAAHEVDIEGAVTDPTALKAYVASNARGLAIVNVSQPATPVLLGDLDLDGVNNDVDVDVARGLAAVAGGFAGLHIVDVSDPLAPALVATVPLVDGAGRVEVLDGLAIVASGARLVSIDLASHEVRQTLTLGSNTITDVATEGAMIYTMDTGLNLRAVSLDGLVMTPHGSVTMLDAGGKLFVTDGVVYAAVASPPRLGGLGGSGFSTVDVSDPDHLIVLSDSDTSSGQELAKIGIAANGSGLAVLAGEPKRGIGEDTRRNELDVMSVANLTSTAALITRLAMPALPRAVALAAGFAFVADDIAGLQIVGIVPFDTAGKAPSASIAATPADGDAGSPGIQVLEGRSFALTTRVADDVQVRSVELLVNGQVVNADVAAPWSFFVTPPPVRIAGDVLTVQVRATDTGDNTALSNLLTFTVVADSKPPVLLDTTPDPGQRIVHVPAIDLTFDEGLDPARLDPSGFSLVNLGADQVAGTADDSAVGVTSLSLHDAGRILTIVPAGELAPGLYLLTVAPAVLADIAGKQVTPGVELSFTVPRVNALQAASGSPADPEQASANPAQEIHLVVPWGPEAAQITFPVLYADGTQSTTTIRPFRTDPSTHTAWFVVSDEAVTGDVGVSGGKVNDISDLPNWSITRGSVDVVSTSSLYPGDGLFLNLVGKGETSTRIESKTLFDLAPGDYQLSFRLAGPTAAVNDPNNGVTVSFGGLFSEFFHRNYRDQFAPVTRTITVTSPSSARLVFDQSQQTSYNGIQLDDVVLTRIDSGAVLLADHFDLTFPQGGFPLQIVPVVTGVDVTSVTSAGTMSVALSGLGFIEGNNTIYRFGAVEIADPSTTTGPDVVKPALDEHANSRSVLTLPFSNDAFGAISVTTAGGTSAPLVVNVQQITATAISGIPTDPGLASANTGQLVTVTGAGLTTDTDFVLRYRDPNGVDKSLLVNPVFANVDHTMAQLVVPDVANGIFPVRTLGSTFAPQLQVVPQLEQVKVEPAFVPDGAQVHLTGHGFFEGDSAYQFGPSTVFDAELFLGPDVVGANTATVPFIPAGYGPVGVTTPGGTSAPLDWSTLIPRLGPLLDVAYSAAAGEIFVALGTTINRIDPTTGASVGSFPIPLVVQTTRVGLQILPAPINLGGTAVPAGSLLVTLAASPDTIVAVNLDPTAGFVGATLASMSLAGIATSAPGVVLDPASGDLFILDGDLDRLVKVDPVSGSVVATFALPFAVDKNAGGLAIEPTTGHLWVGSVASTDVAEVDPATGTVIRLLSLASQGLSAEISGLSFDAAGNLLVSSTLGVVYRLTTFLPVLPAPSLTAIDAVAPAGVPTDATIASANAGQVVTIVGTGFRRGDLQVLFPTRDELGVVDVATVLASVVNDTGTVAQVRVPLHAATGPVRVVSAGSSSGASSPVPLQIVPTIEFGQTTLDLEDTTIRHPGANLGFLLTGSGFMSGASTIQVGGIVMSDAIAATGRFDNVLDPYLLPGFDNGRYSIFALGLTVEGPIRITTAGGWFEAPRFPFLPQVSSTFTGIRSVAEEGTPADPSLPSANTGQLIALLGTGLNYNPRYVTFDAVDETGIVGTITRVGSTVVGQSASAIDLTIEVPLLARTGPVRIPGADANFLLQIVPTIQGVTPLVAGHRAMLEGSGFPEGDLTIRIDGQLATDLDVEAVTERNRTDKGLVGGQELVTFMVPAGIGAGVVTVTTSGGSATVRSGFAVHVLPDVSPAADVGDSRENALPVDLPTGSRVTIASRLDPTVIAPSGDEQPDTDVYSISLTHGDRLVISFEMPGGQRIGYAALFDPAGQRVGSIDNGIDEDGLIQRTEVVVPSDGTYFLFVNDDTDDSGYADGPYRLRLERLLPATSTLTGIESVAAAGTAARTDMPSANVGQRITITGAGLSVADPVFFSGVDHHIGGFPDGVRVIPVSASPDGRSLEVIVPESARTGKIWLSGEDTGIVLQIVPFLTRVDLSSGRTLTETSLLLSGTGVEDPVVVHFGDVDMVDYSRVEGTPTFEIPFLDEGIPFGPISLSSAGGTSAPFDGFAVDAVVAVAAVGAPPDPALPSANPRQTITIRGRGFTSRTPIVFTTLGLDGLGRSWVVAPSTVDDDGSSLTVEVPFDAVTGQLAVIGDPNGFSVQLQIVPVS
jgi:membrane-associated phospholipid phosphatase